MHFPSLKSMVAASLLTLISASAATAQLVIAGEHISDAATYEAAKRQGRVVIYGVYPPDAMKIILNDFEADTGIKAEFIRLPTQVLYPRVLAEFSAKRLQADVIDLTDLSLVDDLTRKGVLAPHKVPSFARIPDGIKDPDGHWYSLIQIVTIIAVNTARVAEKDMPTSWNDLYDPKWKGNVGMLTIDVGGSAVSQYAYLRHEIDAEFWPKLMANQLRIYPTIAPMVTDVARGEVAMVTGGISEMVIGQIKAGAPLRIVLPKEGLSAFAPTGGIASTAKNPQAAALYIDWMTSKRGGASIAKTGSYGAHPDAPSPVVEGQKYPSLEKVWQFSLEDTKRYREPYVADWHKIFKK